MVFSEDPLFKKASVWKKYRPAEPEAGDKLDEAAKRDQANAAAQEGNTTGRYVPPSARGGSGGGSTLDTLRMQEQKDRDALTLRVSNLSEDVREGDLQELFGQFGRLQRVFLGKCQETNNSKGWAFISYHSKADAEMCIKRLNGHGYDNLVLKVDWSKPQAQRDAAPGR